MQDMSPRTRVLAYFVFGLAGLIVVGGGMMWFKGKLDDKKARIRTAEAELDDMLSAQRRYAYVNSERKKLLEKSLSRDINLAKGEYKNWLTDLAHSHIEINANVKPAGVTEKEVRGSRSVVFYQMRFDLDGVGTFEQCMQLLDDYYNADVVHRISSLQLTPLSERNIQDARRNEATRIEKVKIRFTSEVLLLPDAPKEGPEIKELSPYYDLAKVRETHRQTLTRDFFSPATELPEVDLVSSRAVSRGKVSFEVGNGAEFEIEGEDDDIMDELSFVLDEKSIPRELQGKVHLEPAGDRNRARIIIDEIDEDGSWDFVVKATDNGFPAEQVDKLVSINVEPKPVVVQTPPTVKEQPKRVDFAELSVVTAIVHDRHGTPYVWIDVKPEAEIYRLTVGDEIEVGSFAGVVERIEVRNIFIRSGDRLLRYTTDCVLSEPDEVVTLTNVRGD